MLTPRRYLSIEEEEILFEEKMKELTSQLIEHIEEGKKLDEEIKKNMAGIGWDV